MSGGSFNYFYSRGPEKLSSVARTLANMAIECGDDERFSEIVSCLKDFSERLDNEAKELSKLQGVTRAIEWWASGDSGPAEVLEEWSELKAIESQSRNQ